LYWSIDGSWTFGFLNFIFELLFDKILAYICLGVEKLVRAVFVEQHQNEAPISTMGQNSFPENLKPYGASLKLVWYPLHFLPL